MQKNTKELLDLSIQIKNQLVTEHGLGKWLIDAEEEFVHCMIFEYACNVYYELMEMEDAVREVANVANKYNTFEACEIGEAL